MFQLLHNGQFNKIHKQINWMKMLNCAAAVQHYRHLHPDHFDAYGLN
jgi:hypothetical protein